MPLSHFKREYELSDSNGNSFSVGATVISSEQGRYQGYVVPQQEANRQAMHEQYPELLDSMQKDIKQMFGQDVSKESIRYLEKIDDENFNQRSQDIHGPGSDQDNQRVKREELNDQIKGWEADHEYALDQDLSKQTMPQGHRPKP